MELNLYKRKFFVTSKDRIMDNGACYQLITQTYYKDWYQICPLVSKTLFRKLLKEGKIVLSKEKYLGCDLYEFIDTEKKVSE